MNEAKLNGRLCISGSFDCRDAEGNILKTITISGSVPLDQAGLSPEQLAELPQYKGADDGADNRE